MILQTAMFSRFVLLVAMAAFAFVRSEIFDLNPKHFEANPACFRLNQTFYSYIYKILKNLKRKYRDDLPCIS